MLKKHVDLLGFVCKDKVTNFTGVITSISFDLHGCIQALVTPGINKDKNLIGSNWFDINRLEIISNNPVMQIPEFEHDKGAAEKPLA